MALALGVMLAAAGAARGASELPAVARPRLRAAAGGETGSGTAFFLALPGGGTAAVAAAHNIALTDLTACASVDFRLGKTGTTVARSQRLLAPPGEAFRDAKGPLRDDVMVFALDAPPQGARILSAGQPGEAQSGERVRILGVPALVPQDEDDVFGRIAQADDARLEIDLDVSADLRGWGGAPVLSAKSGRVLGLLEAAWPAGTAMKLGAAPIGGVLDVLAQPLEAGRGAPFRSFASGSATADAHAQEPPAVAARPPPPSAASAGASAGAEPTPEEISAEHAREAQVSTTEEEVLSNRGGFDDGSAGGAQAGTASAPAAGTARSAAPTPTAVASARDAGPAALVKPHPATKLDLSIEYPHDGAVTSGPVGGFLSGHALALQGEMRTFDVMIVIDVSLSTGEATGVDVNGNGIVGATGLRGLFRKVDPGDSILAAEVAAAKRLLTSIDPRTARIGVVSFAGGVPESSGIIVMGSQPPAATTEQPLTSDVARVDRALDMILARGPWGNTHMAAGLDQATIELMGMRGALSEPHPKSTKVVFFLTDGLPTLPFEYSLSENVRAAVRAADRARRAHIQVHTFAIGQEALSGPIAPVEMAGRTGGVFTPVRNPADIVSMMQQVSLANIESVTVKNLTNGKDAEESSLGLDGSWSALVALAPGKNRIQVTARSSDGLVATREVTLQSAPDVPLPPVPPALAASRNALLERRLAALKQVGVGIEQQRTEQTRREIALEIQRERDEAEVRAAQQRRELRIEPEGAQQEDPR